jgi:hypothetical protein
LSVAAALIVLSVAVFTWPEEAGHHWSVAVGLTVVEPPDGAVLLNDRRTAASDALLRLKIMYHAFPFIDGDKSTIQLCAEAPLARTNFVPSYAPAIIQRSVESVPAVEESELA